VDVECIDVCMTQGQHWPALRQCGLLVWTQDGDCISQTCCLFSLAKLISPPFKKFCKLLLVVSGKIYCLAGRRGNPDDLVHVHIVV